MLSEKREGFRPKSKTVIQNKKNNVGIILSPGKSIGVRFALRNALKQKQRKAGNSWLARELGYRTEEDHLKDCKIAAEEKRGMVLKLEQERLKANERKQLRERIILQEQNYVAESDTEDEAYSTPAEHTEEDEEMKLAKEIEQEAEGKGPDDLKDAKPGSIVYDGIETKESSSSLDLEVECNNSAIYVDNEKAESHLLRTQPSETQSFYSSKSIQCDEKESKKLLPGSDLSGKRLVSDPLSVPGNASKSSTEESLPETQSVLFGVENENKLQDSKDVDNQMVAAEQTSPYVTNDSETHTEGKELIIETVTEPEDSVVGPHKKEVLSDDNDELEFDNDKRNAKKSFTDPNRPRNAGWQTMLKREAQKLKKLKKRNGGLVEEEAEEEEEEEVAGLEDFGFSISKKKKDNDEDDYGPCEKIDDEDLKHVVDELSDDEGDEDAGRLARTRLEQREENDRHKEILRRMREGYDGRRGGIAGGGNGGARGMHRFDQLVAADNRDDAKRLGLLNDDELDSEDEKEREKAKNDKVDEEEDETALLDKMLKDRFLHRSDVDLEENFSEDEVHEVSKENSDESDDEEKSQERLAKRFAKRARMQRLEEMYGDNQEFSQQLLIDEDVSMKEELSNMRCGLLRRSSSFSRRSSQSSDTSSSLGYLSRKRQRNAELSYSTNGGSFFRKTSGSLSIALRASQKQKCRSSFLGGNNAVDGKEMCSVYKTVQLGHVVFNSQASQSHSGFGSFSNSNKGNLNTNPGNQKQGSSNSSLFSKVSGVA